MLSDDHQRQFGAAGESTASLRPETYAVQCVVVAGRAPAEPNMLKSFELYRNGLNGVTVITYDELLLKLTTLHRLLKDPGAERFATPTVTTKRPDRTGRRTRKLPRRGRDGGG